MNQSEVSDIALSLLRGGLVPWRYPQNQFPPFKRLFGSFTTGAPLKGEEVFYASIAALISYSQAKMCHDSRIDTPRYDRPPKDTIMLPPRSVFPSEASYWATVIHEMVHWLEWRIGWSGSLAAGELIAEIATANVESHFRLPHDLCRANIEKWLPDWAAEIQADPAYFFDAVAHADRAAKHLLSLNP